MARVSEKRTDETSRRSQPSTSRFGPSWRLPQFSINSSLRTLVYENSAHPPNHSLVIYNLLHSISFPFTSMSSALIHFLIQAFWIPNLITIFYANTGVWCVLDNRVGSHNIPIFTAFSLPILLFLLSNMHLL